MRARAFWPVALVGLALASRALAAGAPIPPAPTRWVTDTAAFLSPQARAELDARLEAVERATGHQVVVWIGDTIGDAPLDDWAVRTFAAWKVGRKGFDDGLAVFILAGDRKIDIEVGYGLEGQVPDATAARIIRDVMTPRLEAGDKDGAVRAGVDALLGAIGAADAAPGGPPQAVAERRPTVPVSQIVLFAILAVGFVVLLITNPRMAMFFVWAILSGGRGGGFGGGGASGGGGFSGGGGRSGGGGARGSW
jgi:uncharacterized protein